MADVPAIREEGEVEAVEQKVVAPAKPESLGIKTMLANAGKIKLQKKDLNTLFAPINPDDIEIMSDGTVYLPWMSYAERLRDLFGLEYAFIPQKEQPDIQTREDTDRNGQPRTVSRIVWGFWLIIKGIPAAFAWGEHVYYSNSGMGYTDSCESAKSEAVRRCCKQIGIGLELWKPSYIRKWKEKYAAKGQKGWERKKQEHDTSELKQTVKEAISRYSKAGGDPEYVGQMIDLLETAQRADLQKMLADLKEKEIGLMKERQGQQDAAADNEEDEKDLF